MIVGLYTFRLRTETGDPRYTVRIDDPEAEAFLKRLPNRSEFFRQAVEHELATRLGGRPSAGLPEELVNRLARMEEMLQGLGRLEKAVEGLRTDVGRMLLELKRIKTLPPAGAVPAQDSEDDRPENPLTPEDQEEMRQLRELMLNFGQPKGGDQA